MPRLHKESAFLVPISAFIAANRGIWNILDYENTTIRHRNHNIWYKHNYQHTICGRSGPKMCKIMYICAEGSFIKRAWADLLRQIAARGSMATTFLLLFTEVKSRMIITHVQTAIINSFGWTHHVKCVVMLLSCRRSLMGVCFFQLAYLLCFRMI